MSDMNQSEAHNYTLETIQGGKRVDVTLNRLNNPQRSMNSDDTTDALDKPVYSDSLVGHDRLDPHVPDDADEGDSVFAHWMAFVGQMQTEFSNQPPTVSAIVHDVDFNPSRSDRHQVRVTFRPEGFEDVADFSIKRYFELPDLSYHGDSAFERLLASVQLNPDQALQLEGKQVPMVIDDGELDVEIPSHTTEHGSGPERVQHSTPTSKAIVDSETTGLFVATGVPAILFGAIFRYPELVLLGMLITCLVAVLSHSR